MNIKNLNSIEIKKEIESKLNSGWCVICAKSEFMEILEELIYPPKTPKNNDFEILFISSGNKIGFISFGKKTDDLKAFIKNPIDFDEILLLEFNFNGVDELKVEMCGYADKLKGSKEITNKIMKLYNINGV